MTTKVLSTQATVMLYSFSTDGCFDSGYKKKLFFLCLMKLWVFQDLKRPRRKCLKEILIRWREWASMGLVLPSRCALLDWLLKPLNLLQRKSSTQIDGNNQYVPAALFTFQKPCTSVILSLSHSCLFFFTLIIYFLHSLYIVSSVTSSLTSMSLCSPPGRTGQSVSCRGPPVPYSADSHLGCVSSRQPGSAGTVGTGQAFPGETYSRLMHRITHFPGCHLIEETSHFHTQCSLNGQHFYYTVCYCSASVIVDLSEVLRN